MPLPKFEGRVPAEQRLVVSLSHTVAADEHDPHHVGDTIYLIVEAEVLHVNHKRSGDGTLTRIETTAGRRYGIVIDHDEAKRLLAQYGAAQQELDL